MLERQIILCIDDFFGGYYCGDGDCDYIHLMAVFLGQAGTRIANHSGFYWSKR